MIELMISIAMISIVMVFLVKLLIQTNYEQNHQFYNNSDAIRRTEIITTVENDFIINPISNFSKNNNEFIFTNSKGSSNLRINENDILYKNISGKQMKWSFKKNNEDVFIDISDMKCYVIKSNDNNKKYYSFTLKIPVYLNKDEKNVKESSVLDDYIFTFYGQSTDLNMHNICEEV